MLRTSDAVLSTARAGIAVFKRTTQADSHNSICFGGRRWGAYLRRKDLIISGKERSSEGKGFRAIAYAAFMIGLLDYCADSRTELPHPGIVVLDSPLVTYKRRDTTPGEEISEDVTAAFYEALAKLPAGKQVIVLENNDPPAAIHGQINYTHFSRSATGRYGFFPVT